MRSEDVERYRGRWVALTMLDETVVSSADSYEELHALLQREEHEPVLLRRIPTLDEPIYIGLG